MTQNVSESSTWTTTVTSPAGGDSMSSASVLDPVKDIVDRTKYLRDHSLGADARVLSVPIAHGIIDAAGGNWVVSGGPATGSAVTKVQSDVSAATGLIFELGPGMLPPLAPVTEVKAYIKNLSAHGGLPATLPKLYFEEYDFVANGDGAPSYTVNQVDTSANQAAYDAAHQITLVVSRTIDIAKRYAVVLRGETGANAAANKLQLVGLRITWTAP